jgi:hypothetical protein
MPIDVTRAVRCQQGAPMPVFTFEAERYLLRVTVNKAKEKRAAYDRLLFVPSELLGTVLDGTAYRVRRRFARSPIRTSMRMVRRLLGTETR